MNKYLLLLIFPLLSFMMVGCDDDDKVDDVIAPDLIRLAGMWEVVDQGNQDVFVRTCILDMTSSRIHEGYGGYQGNITSYFLTVDGKPKNERAFTWTILEVENNQPLLDVVYQGVIDSDDPRIDKYSYKIVKLTDANMWWQVNSSEDNNTIKFRRRDDIHIE